MSTPEYAFSDRAQEQRRLASQAELFASLTERVFRAAGVGTGMRVLDLGSGAGDVAILAGRLVGHTWSQKMRARRASNTKSRARLSRAAPRQRPGENQIS